MLESAYTSGRKGGHYPHERWFVRARAPRGLVGAGARRLLAKKRFDEEFEHRLKTAKDASLSILMADIDNLKKINDQHGHLLGEFVVGAVGRIIGELHETEGRRATRFGGDEYQTILPNLSKKEALV